LSTLYRILEESAKTHPDRTALIFRDHAICYRAVKEAADRLAAGLKKLGLGSGDRIALMLPNVPHFAFGFFACQKVGAAVITLSGSYRADEIHRRLEDSEAKAILFYESFRQYVLQAVQGLERCPHLLVLGDAPQAGEIRLGSLMEIHEPLVETFEADADATALIVYTGGMSGHVKGAELTHSNLLSNAEACQQFLRLQPGDGTVGVMPLSHPIGLTLTLNAFLAAGGSVDLHPKFDAASVLASIEKHRLTHFIGVPAMFAALSGVTEGPQAGASPLKCAISTGDGLRQEVMDDFEAKFNIPVLEGYGLTEASPMVSFNSPNRERRAGSIGLPLPGVDIKIVGEDDREVRPGQVGEIIVQGPNVMKGYLNRPEATREALRDGWLRTGDLALLDESGFGFIVARKKNVIVKSGFSVYPVEVERVISAHPKILEAVVVGLPDPAQGEEIHACAVLRAGEQAEEAEIIRYVRERIAVYKCPKSIHFCASLPKGPTGKVLREKVKQQLMEK
jgi:long-chain acyl-CoA synthetase